MPLAAQLRLAEDRGDQFGRVTLAPEARDLRDHVGLGVERGQGVEQAEPLGCEQLAELGGFHASIVALLALGLTECQSTPYS